MARTTIVNQPRQHRLDPPQIREFPPHILELLLGEHARFVAVSAVIQSQQPGHLIELKPSRCADLTNFTRATSASP